MVGCVAVCGANVAGAGIISGKVALNIFYKIEASVRILFPFSLLVFGSGTLQQGITMIQQP